MLSRAQDLECDEAVIDGARGEDDGVDVAREQLLVAAGRDPEVLPDGSGPVGSRGGDGDELRTRNALRVLGVQRAHPAETGDAKPERTRRP